MTKETELKLIQQEIKDLESLLKALKKHRNTHYKLVDYFDVDWTMHLNGMERSINNRLKDCKNLNNMIQLESKKVSKKKELV